MENKRKPFEPISQDQAFTADEVPRLDLKDDEDLIPLRVANAAIEQDRAEHDALRAQLAEAREVIEFYAAEKNWVIPAGSGDITDYIDACCELQKDGGDKARAWLAARGGGGGE